MPDDNPRFGLPSAKPGPVDYETLARKNARRYGTEWPRIGGMLLADRYAERTHFIYELLQNAEDALRKRSGWDGRRSIKFDLSETCLRISHFGKPFEEPDVCGICGISESTKDLTSIGRFGIGFKSVYAFTDRPEVHSGAEDFAIEGYIRPVAADPVNRDPDETVILIPLRARRSARHRNRSRFAGRKRAPVPPRDQSNRMDRAGRSIGFLPSWSVGRSGRERPAGQGDR